MVRADVVTIQPGPSDGKDAMVAQFQASTNYGTSATLASGYGPDFGGSEKRAYLQFDLSSIPTGATINSATLSIYVSSAAGGSQTAGVYKVTASWSAGGITWNNQPSFNSSAETTTTVNSIGWKSWTITSLVSGWKGGTITNNGVVVKESSGSPPDNVQYYSSDYTGNTTLRPKLVVDYTGGGPTAVTLNNPTNVQQNQMTLTWSQNTDGNFQSYKVYRATTAGVTQASALVTTINQQATISYNDTGLNTNTAYYYKVYVTNTSGASAGSNEVSATTLQPSSPPTAVTLNAPTNVQQNQMTLTWSQNADANFQSYKLYRSTTAGVTEQSTLVTTQNQQPTTTFTDTGLTANTAYYYKVYVVNTSNVTVGSNEVTATSATANTHAIQLTADPTTVPADGQSLSTLTATVTDNGQAVTDGTEVTFTTDWGKLLGSQATPPQTLQATTINGQATATLIAADTAPGENGTFTVSATSGGAVASLQAQAQQAGPNDPHRSLVLEWRSPPGDGGCKGNGDTVSGCVVAHLFVVVNAGTHIMLEDDSKKPQMRAQEVNQDHSGPTCLWKYGPVTPPVLPLVVQTYPDPAKPLPTCAPQFDPDHQTLYDINGAWGTDAYHNGKWTLHAEYWYSSQGNGMPQPTKDGAAIEFTLNNLLVRVSEDSDHPPLLKWYGPWNTNNKTEVKFTLSCQGSVGISPVVRIYDLARSASPDSNNALRTLNLLYQEVTTAGTEFKVTWDGMDDNGHTVAAGLYAFTVDASWQDDGATYFEHDTKTSKYLSLYLPKVDDRTTTCVEYLAYNTNSNKQQFKVTYVLKDTAGTAASAGHIDLYKPDLSSVALKTLSDSDLTASANGSEHNVTVEVDNSDLTQAGKYQFVVSIMDNHANDEKGHRKKPGLEVGQELERRLLIKKPAGYEDWLPTGANEGTPQNVNTMTIEARIQIRTGGIWVDLPDNAQSALAAITFTIDPSSLPGYCMNGGASTDKDYDFVQGTTPVTITPTAAVTNSAVARADVILRSLDHGGYTTVTASAPGCTTVLDPAFTNTLQAHPIATSFTVPEDVDGDHIADSWERANGLDPTNPSDGTADNDNLPAGNGNPGDRLINFEEYRGFKRWTDPWVQGGEYFRTSPRNKDLFLQIDASIPEGCGYAVNLPVDLHRHAIGDEDCDTEGKINFNSAGIVGHIDQRAIRVVEEPCGNPMSATGDTRYINGRKPPNTGPYLVEVCVLYRLGIRWESPPHTDDPDTVDPADVQARKETIAHEIGHGINMSGDYQHGDRGPHDSIMVQGIPDWGNMPSDYDTTDVSQIQIRDQ